MGKPNAGAQLFANTGGGAPSPAVPAAAGTSAGARLFHGAAPAQPAEKPQPHHHGLLGSIVHEAGHVVGQTASDLEHAAINTPAGLYQLGKAGFEASTGHPQDAINLGKAYVHGVVQDVEHPLRHPGFTLLDALSVVDLAGGAVGRVAAIGKAVEAGGTAGDLIKAGVKRPAMGTRTLRSGDLKVHPETSPSFVGSRVQKLTDKALQNAADKNPAGRAGQLLNRKIGKTVTAEARQATRNARGPAQALLKIGRRLKPGEQKALQVVAEQAPLEQRITAASARVTGAKDTLTRGRHQGELDLLHEAKPHLTVDAAGKPALAEPRLQAVYAKMATVAGDREALLKSLGLLTDESIASRTAKAARVSLGEPLDHPPAPEPAIKGQLSLIEEPKQDLFTPGADAVRIPDVATKKGVKALHTQATVGAQGTIGHLKAPGSVTHDYGGVLREHGLRRQDTTTLVAESGLEAAKYAGLKHIHQLVRQAVTATPTRPDDIAVRLDELGSHDKLPHEVRKFLADPEEYFKASTPAEQASMLDKARQMHFFPGEDKGGGWKVDAKADPAAAAEFERLHAAGKIGFVPRRILGELGNPTAPLRAVAPGKAVGTVDAINNASRFAILYLKPAYALPNVLGNAALGLIQQGFAAPRNLAQAARLVQRLPEGDYQRIDAAMGEGLARAASAHGAGRMSAVVDKAANVWSSAVDTPFRRAAFLHEARQAGYKTPAQIHELLGRDAHDPELIRVGIKSNRDAIDYENLSNREKEIVRRVVFFYPWIKGSTVYAGRFVRDHPTTAAVAAQVGRQGQQFSQQGVGRMPSYLEGLIPTGKDTVSNPTSAAILQTPAQIGMALQGLASGNIPEAAAASNFITPALSLALAEGLRTNPSTGAAYKPGTNAGAVAENVLGNNLPQVTLYKALHAALTGSGGSKLYPPSIRSALTQFLAGSIAPRKIDKQDLERLYALEQRKMKYGR